MVYKLKTATGWASRNGAWDLTLVAVGFYLYRRAGLAPRWIARGALGQAA